MSSFPSKKLTLVDVPGVKSPSAKFEYNFFVKDEMVSDDGILSVENTIRSGEFSANSISDLVTRFSPRDVKITFMPPKIRATGNEFVTTPGHFGAEKKIDISKYRNNIYDERTFSNGNFTVLNLQDTGIDGKLFFYVSGSVASRVQQKNRRTASKIGDITGDVVQAITSPMFSLLDAAKTLNAETPDTVTGEFLVDALNNIDALGALFIDGEKQTETTNTTFERIKNFSLKSQISDRILGDVIQTIASDPSSIYSDEAVNYLSTARKVQKEAAAAENFNVALGDYDLVVEPISYRRIEVSTFQPRVEIIGFIADKHELFPDGTLETKDSVISNNPVSSVILDTRVRYGATYIYSVRTVALVETQVSSPETGDIVAASFLVSSEPTKKMKVRCVENIPPPPPTDVTGYWDFDAGLMTLSWAYPVNPQRDVKKFQVFRRQTQWEPFTMVREFDFDDSVIPVTNREAPQADSTKKIASPVNLMTDYDFAKDSKFIYSVCAIDAHGLTSNYSSQIEVSFDRSTNRLVKKLVSISNAPKSYPNMYFRNDLFEDTIKVSGTKKMTLYFTPEYLEVTKRNGTKFGLLATDSNGGMYRLQVINTDLQKDSSIDISLKNLRTNN